VKLKGMFTAFAASYFAWVFLRDGTMIKLIEDASRGAKDIAKGLRGPARLA
jgi:hypothetical protein